VEFKINKDVLDFIYLYADEYNLLTPYNIDYTKLKSKMLKREFTELESYLSKLYLQENILGLADIYYKIPGFYLPVRIDSRGRVNCVSQYLNYQSNELAKSLLLFSKGEKLMKNDKLGIGYFKAYGANCFGHKLNKKS
jgi:DNA-directed RNA polymerase